jgi:DNA helicase-2/ATP-dependent DNA helicase PcrA
VADLPDTYSDKRIKVCIRRSRSFAVVAGAGSGKTTSLRKVMEQVRAASGPTMRPAGQRIACITYTNRAVKVIQGRLGADDLFNVSTLNGFLWAEIKAFQREIRSAVSSHLIPMRIAKKKEDDNGGNSQDAKSARRRIQEFEQDLIYLNEHRVDFTYEETGGGSRFSKGRLDHADVVDLFSIMISLYPALKKVIGQKYPYIFVDEAQDTFPVIMEALNHITEGGGLPLVGYFGDPMQQIYEKRAGKFHGPSGSAVITKPENYRCSTEVIKLLNRFRQDVQQTPGSRNIKGSVEIRLVRAEPGEGPRKTYTEPQIARAIEEFDRAVSYFGWEGDQSVKRLFLARQMIARRLGFTALNNIFTGRYASQSAQSDYEDGVHYLLLPFLRVLWPLVKAAAENDQMALFRVLREESPLLDPKGENGTRTIKDVTSKVDAAVKIIVDLWPTSTTRDILRTARDSKLIRVSDRLEEHLNRAARTETYSEELHALDKGDWLADSFFALQAAELPAYASFVKEETALSTQHGVKGEEYNRVLVMFDDTEANWNNYNFSRLLTPGTAGGALTEGQKDRGTKLAYVCFSRAERDLRIILFTPSPASAKAELVASGLFEAEQISLQA